MELSNAKDLKISILPNGSVGTIQHRETRINLRSASIHGASGTGLFARIHDKDIRLIPLIGPMAKGSFGMADHKVYTITESDNLKSVAELKLSPDETAWMWTIMFVNNGLKPITLDAVCVQDAGLRKGSHLVNEYYVSQYTERRLLESHLYGKVAVCRQNMREADGHPWLMMACPEGAEAGATDGAQVFGPANRNAALPPGLLQPELSGEYAGESSLLALQTRTYTLNPAGGIVVRFLFLFMADHPEPTSPDDLQRVRPVLGSFEAFNPMPYMPWKQSPRKSIFNPPVYAEAAELTDQELSRFFGRERNHAEYHKGILQSFFAQNSNHIVLKSKEMIVYRPHGHIIRSGKGMFPDERVMSTNPFMAGVFNAHVTSGNTNFNVLHSVYTNQFGLASPAGQRIFLKNRSHWFLLGVPSAFEMGFNFCRWIYKLEESLLEVVTWTSADAHQVNYRLKVLSGQPADLLIAHHFDAGNRYSVVLNDNFEATIRPAVDSLMGQQFPEAVFASFLADCDGQAEAKVELTPGESDEMLIYNFSGTTCVQGSFGCFHGAEAVQCAPADFEKDAMPADYAWRKLALGLELRSSQTDLLAINTILPWFGTNALTHYITPYGLEQFGGAAWGTRDVSQGPIELLLSLGRYHEARHMLKRIFSNQHPDGGWPQWWMFDSYARIRAHEAHGDITYWVMIALSNYLHQTGDYEFLQEPIPWFNPEKQDFESPSPLAEHIEKWLEMITASFITGTSLVPFGGGDWNDSLQPASSLLAARLISSWTVEMSYQAFQALASALKTTAFEKLASQLLELSNKVHDDFHKYLVKDGVVAGYGRLEDDGSISLLLHPSDTETGISYSILPMNRGVLSKIFTKEQAEQHMQIISKYLKGPDGARLMDKPLKYSGGQMKIFQRAETSTYFGREIGLMYVHEHIRHAEALAMLGKAEAFVQALRQAIPVDYLNIVRNAAPRQSNCYYSSSDIVFANRYEADEKYHLLHSGELTFKGGWRVYSSGPGIFVALIINRLLGFRFAQNMLIIDPVMPLSFDGLEVSFQLFDKPVLLRYHIKHQSFSPRKIVLNGRSLTFAGEQQHFRKGGVLVAVEGLKPLLKDHDNMLEIML
ncbi:MAG TPA: amylo-alpha-1,6-glucosidase [Bacteroidales bacterium]|nr:amylo-alpha-1,6-glucosidase [Bacteroidales bacterium]